MKGVFDSFFAVKKNTNTLIKSLRGTKQSHQGLRKTEKDCHATLAMTFHLKCVDTRLPNPRTETEFCLGIPTKSETTESRNSEP